MAVQEFQLFGEAWTRPSVRGTTNSVGRHQGEIELFVTVLPHDRVQLALDTRYDTIHAFLILHCSLVPLATAGHTHVQARTMNIDTRTAFDETYSCSNLSATGCHACRPRPNGV